MSEETGFDAVEPAPPGADWAGKLPGGYDFIMPARVKRIAQVVHVIERYEQSPKVEDRNLIALVKTLDLNFDEMGLLVGGLKEAAKPRGRPKLTGTPTLALMAESEAELTAEWGRKPKMWEVVARVAEKQGKTDPEIVKKQATRERKRVKQGGQ